MVLTFTFLQMTVSFSQAENYSPTLAPLMLHNHSSFVRNNKEIVIFGGGGNCFSFGTHFNTGIICIDVSTNLATEVR